MCNFFPCFLCPWFKIKRLCSHLPHPRLIPGPEQDQALLVQYRAPLSNTFPLFKGRCMDRIVVIISLFLPHFASAMSSGSFRARLHKHAGKDSEERETLICFTPTVKGFSETPHQAGVRIFCGGGHGKITPLIQLEHSSPAGSRNGGCAARCCSSQASQGCPARVWLWGQTFCWGLAARASPG